jgi:hypothetical protein
MFAVILPDHPLRAETEAAIRAAYLREHEARLSVLPRTLVAEIDERGVACAASLRFAEDGFFSERYLDQPIESLVSRHSGTRADRNALAEVGSLAAVRPGLVRTLVGGVIEHLSQQGVRWAFFTATARLRILLRWSGIPLIELAGADPARVDNAQAWGGYYHHDPRVMLVGDYMLSPLLHPHATVVAARGHHA